MATKYKIIIAVVALASAFATGRWLAPNKTVVVTKTVTVDTKKDETKTDAKKNTKTVKTETDKPDGTKVITTVTTTNSDTQSASNSTEKEKVDAETSKTTSRSTSHLILSGMVGIPVSFGGAVTPIYGGQIYKEVLGPVGIGAWYLSNNNAGMSVGLSF
jgi:hypothetical protein